MILFFTGTAILVIMLVTARKFEKRPPIEAEQSTAEVVVDWKLAAFKWSTSQLLKPVTSAYTMLLVATAGGGWIHLLSDGWWFLLSFIVLILALDFWTYLIHRAQHKLPVLWAMHSL